MADNKTPNPGAAWQEMVTQWERNFDAFANQMMGTEGFSQAMNEAQKAQLGFQKNMSEAMGRQLAAANMPTREDVLRLGEVLVNIERRLERIEERLGADVTAAPSSMPRPPRTKQPKASEEGQS